MHHFKRMITAVTSLIASVLLSISLAHATDVEVTPVPESEINYNLDDAKIDLSDIDAEDIANVQDEIKAMEEAENPYIYLEGLSDLEQRSIIAAMEQGQEINIKDPDEVWGFEPEQDDGGDGYDGEKWHRLTMAGLEMSRCVAALKSYSTCQWAADKAKEIEAHLNQKYGEHNPTLVDGKGDAYRHCYWNASMYIALGPEATEYIATSHELMNLMEARIEAKEKERKQGKQAAKEHYDKKKASSQMDYFNNAQGRVIGAAFAEKKGEDDKEREEGARRMCERWSETGVLKTIRADGL